MSKKFRFKLASILKLRQHQTEQKKQDLAKKMKDRKSQEKQVSEAKELLTQALKANSTDLWPSSGPGFL